MLKTDRTLIRPFKESDFESLKIMMSDNDVMKFTGFGKPQSEERIYSLLEKWIKETNYPQLVWCVVNNEKNIKDENKFIGWFMLKQTIIEDPEIGFMITQNQWNKGFATEISKKILEYAFNDLNCKKVIASTNSKNLASIKVLKKLGMKENNDLTKDNKIIFFQIINPK